MLGDAGKFYAPLVYKTTPRSYYHYDEKMANVQSLEEGEELMTELFLKACAMELLPIYQEEIKDYNVC